MQKILANNYLNKKWGPADNSDEVATVDVFRRCKARIAIFSGSKRAMSNVAAAKNIPVLSGCG
jgi:hypothetical protein